jgi:hypothetical protein
MGESFVIDCKLEVPVVEEYYKEYTFLASIPYRYEEKISSTPPAIVVRAA